MLFDLEQAKDLQKDFLKADPFPHIVIDNFLNPDIAYQLSKTFPRVSSKWYGYSNVFEIKRALDDIQQMPWLHSYVLMYFNSRPGVEWLETLTDIKGLISDPWLRGGGLHQIERGGKLDIHADFNLHPHLKLDRRLNVLLYLNENWQDEWNGHLELWDHEMRSCQKKVAPVLNRLVVFETTDTSLHGHPDPLRCPVGVTRKSMAWYFYTNGRPENEKTNPHSTLFKKRPQDDTTQEIEEFRQKRGIRRQDGPT